MCADESLGLANDQHTDSPRVYASYVVRCLRVHSFLLAYVFLGANKMTGYILRHLTMNGYQQDTCAEHHENPCLFRYSPGHWCYPVDGSLSAGCKLCKEDEEQNKMTIIGGCATCGGNMVCCPCREVEKFDKVKKALDTLYPKGCLACLPELPCTKHDTNYKAEDWNELFTTDHSSD